MKSFIRKKSTFLIRKAWRLMLALIGIFFGFSSAVTAQYGAVENVYRIQGKIISDDCNASIQNINLSIKPKILGEETAYDMDLSKTDKSGNFSFILYNHNFNEGYVIHASDADSSFNGQFKDTLFLLDMENINFQRQGVSDWHNEHVNGNPIIYSMRRQGLSPCLETVIINHPQTIAPVPDQHIETPIIPTSPQPHNENANIEPEPLFVPDTSSKKPFLPIDEPTFVVNVYPNPNLGMFDLDIKITETSSAIMKIFDEQMKLISEKELFLNAGMNNEKVDLIKCSAGTYFLTVEGKYIKASIRVIRSK